MARRNAAGSGSIRKKTIIRNGKEYTYFEGRYTLPGFGKQNQKTITGKTEAEVAKKLRAITSSVDSGKYIEPSKMTLGQWLDIWVKEYAGDIKPKTLISYEWHIKSHLKPALGSVKLTALAPHIIQTFYNGLQKGENALSPKTIKNLHGVLHRALSQAVEIRYLNYNPAGACKLPRIIKTEIKPLEENDITRFLDAIKGHQYETLYHVGLFTGMRQGEILGLSWDCIDFQSGTIFIYRQLQKVKGVYRFETLKNNKTRTITPAPSVMEALKELRRTQLEWQLTAGTAWQNKDHLVFTNQLGDHLTHITVYNNFKRIMKLLDLSETRFHDLRHTYAVMALQSGDDIKTVQENLGHHAAAFTLDTYGHLTERAKKESAERMERFIKGIKNP
jgi:integrase